MLVVALPINILDISDNPSLNMYLNLPHYVRPLFPWCEVTQALVVLKDFHGVLTRSGQQKRQKDHRTTLHSPGLPPWESPQAAQTQKVKVIFRFRITISLNRQPGPLSTLVVPN